MKILVTGSSGQVGFELQRALAPLGELVCPLRHQADLAEPESLRALIRQVAPDIIVNPAAYTAVDKAETETALANRVNAEAPGVLGEEAKRLGALVVHYSTDYVFDGQKPGAYQEQDVTNPQSAYGQSKLAGEQALAASGAQHLILRTSWVAGAFGNNFAKTMLRLAAERDVLRVVADQYGAPTSAALIADVTAQLLGQYRRQAVDFPVGLYHLTAKGRVSWFEYAQFVLARAVKLGKTLRVAPEAVEPIATSAYPLPAPRPANSQLDSSRLEQAFGLQLPSWQPGIEQILRLIL